MAFYQHQFSMSVHLPPAFLLSFPPPAFLPPVLPLLLPFSLPFFLKCLVFYFFFFKLVLLFGNSTLYNIFAKNIPVADIVYIYISR